LHEHIETQKNTPLSRKRYLVANLKLSVNKKIGDVQSAGKRRGDEPAEQMFSILVVRSEFKVLQEGCAVVFFNKKSTALEGSIFNCCQQPF